MRHPYPTGWLAIAGMPSPGENPQFLLKIYMPRASSIVHQGMVTNKGLSALPELEHEATGKGQKHCCFFRSPHITQSNPRAAGAAQGALMPRCHWSLTCTFREEGVVLHLGQFYATVLFFNKAL